MSELLFVGPISPESVASVRLPHPAFLPLAEKASNNGFHLGNEQLWLVQSMLERLDLKQDTEPVGICYPGFMERGSGQTTAVMFAAVSISATRKVFVVSPDPSSAREVLSNVLKLTGLDRTPEIVSGNPPPEPNAVYIYDGPAKFMDAFEYGKRIMSETGTDVYIFYRWK